MSTVFVFAIEDAVGNEKIGQKLDVPSTTSAGARRRVRNHLGALDPGERLGRLLGSYGSGTVNYRSNTKDEYEIVSGTEDTALEVWRRSSMCTAGEV